MARYTDRYGLSILGPGDTIQGEGFKFADADRRLIDRILKWAAEEHHHTGDDAVDHTPVSGLGLQVITSGGSIPSGARYYYRYTVIDDDGNESGPSPSQSIDLPGAITPPQAPAPTPIVGTGSLLPGTYSYVFSAYKDASSLETKAVNSAAVLIPGTSTSNSVSLTLPTLPLGATGLNVYRKSPSGMHYLFIASIEPAGATPFAVWVDDGTIDGDCDRSIPPINRTSNSNAVEVNYPGATPSIPGGWSWNIYRTDNPADWGRSFLTSVVPEGATPTTPVTFLDIGGGTQLGGPPNQAQLIKSPPKINLTDAAEVQGTLPPGLLTAPHQLTFSEPGPVTVGEGSFVWVCDFEQADIIHARAHLGIGAVPAAQDVVVDINVYRPGQATPSWESIYADGPDRPRIIQDTNVGDPATPSIRHLVAGDMLRIDVDQSGGGATPTDENLTVNVLMYAKYGSETTSYTWTP